MSILIDKNTKVIVQGLTGNTGSFHTNQALEYFGTQMVAARIPRRLARNGSPTMAPSCRSSPMPVKPRKPPAPMRP